MGSLNQIFPHSLLWQPGRRKGNDAAGSARCAADTA